MNNSRYYKLFIVPDHNVQPPEKRFHRDSGHFSKRVKPMTSFQNVFCIIYFENIYIYIYLIFLRDVYDMWFKRIGKSVETFGYRYDLKINYVTMWTDFLAPSLTRPVKRYFFFIFIFIFIFYFCNLDRH